MQPVERRQQRVRLQWGAVGLCHDKCGLTAELDLWKIDILRRKAATSPPARRGGGGGYRGGGNFTAAVPEAVAFNEVVPSMRDVSTAAAIVAARVRHIPSQADRGGPGHPIAGRPDSPGYPVAGRVYYRGYGYGAAAVEATAVGAAAMASRLIFCIAPQFAGASDFAAAFCSDSISDRTHPPTRAEKPPFRSLEAQIHCSYMFLVIQNGLIYIKAGERFSISLACVQGPRLIARLFG